MVRSRFLKFNSKIKIVITGIGNRSLPKQPESSNWAGWVKQIHKSNYFELVAAHDPSEDSLKRIIERGFLKQENTFKDFNQMLSETECEAIIISNPAEFHYETINKALNNNLYVLVEKPLVTKLSHGIELVNQNKKKGNKVLVAQNWRTKDVGQLLRKYIQNGRLGKIGQIFFRYIRNRENPNYPEYIFDEQYPLLYAMGIHHIDLFRYILNDEIISVSAFSFKPPWSLYGSDTGMNLFMRTHSGTVINYVGTISSLNKAIMQESIIVEGELGTIINDSDWSEPPLYLIEKESNTKTALINTNDEPRIKKQYDKSDKLLLDNFSDVIRNTQDPICDAEDALKSVAVLEACRQSFETKRLVYL